MNYRNGVVCWMTAMAAVAALYGLALQPTAAAAGATGRNVVLILSDDHRYDFMGKWHMRHDDDAPRQGFDHWVSFRGQGTYFNPLLNLIFYHGVWGDNGFYDLRTDPHERHNLIHVPAYRDQIAALQKQLFDELEATEGLLLPVRRPTPSSIFVAGTARFRSPRVRLSQLVAPRSLATSATTAMAVRYSEEPMLNGVVRRPVGDRLDMRKLHSH